VFSGAIGAVRGDPASGETVEILSHDGDWLGRGAFSPTSQIRVRVWTWDADEPVDRELIARRLTSAIGARREAQGRLDSSCYREVFAESDGLPGIVADRYNGLRVVQMLTAGAERWRGEVVDVLARRGDCEGVYERSDVDARELEGLAPRVGWQWGRSPQPREEVRERQLRFSVDVIHGHKTGHYLDQRDNRQVFGGMVSGGRVLDCFAYTGGFTVAALASGAQEVLSIDSSAAALDQARENLVLNGLDASACRTVPGDVFAELRKLADHGDRFDAIVLDPPRFAPTSAQASRAARGYKDINRLAFKLLRPGGRLFTFSCSGGVSPELFQKIVADAAVDARVEASIVGWLGQPEDHPVSLAFPEGRYLKGLVCRVADR
jgi:23S rRNA (cytosine1962-C5)-methyltransferase